MQENEDYPQGRERTSVEPTVGGRDAAIEPPGMDLRRVGEGDALSQPRRLAAKPQAHHGFHMQGMGEHIHRLHRIQAIAVSQQIGQIPR